MGEKYMTKDEIEAAYPEQWVLLYPTKRDHRNETAGGVVFRYGPDKEAVLRAVGELPPQSQGAFYYTGPIPEDVIFLL